jgi:hypothetical protein
VDSLQRYAKNKHRSEYESRLSDFKKRTKVVHIGKELDDELPDLPFEDAGALPFVSSLNEMLVVLDDRMKLYYGMMLKELMKVQQTQSKQYL